MSAETETPKKTTFLTRAMETVRAKENGEGSEEHADHPAFIADTKRFQKRVLVATIGTTAALAVAWKLLSKLPDVDEETSEEINPED
jgi:hypothetical protein